MHRHQSTTGSVLKESRGKKAAAKNVGARKKDGEHQECSVSLGSEKRGTSIVGVTGHVRDSMDWYYYGMKKCTLDYAPALW